MAPVAGGVSDGEQDGDAAGLRLGERLVAPLLPVDRVVLVLEQVRARRAGQPVRHRDTSGSGGRGVVPSFPRWPDARGDAGGGQVPGRAGTAASCRPADPIRSFRAAPARLGTPSRATVPTVGDDHSTRATGLRLRWTPYGTPAYAALRTVIAELKHADPLAAVSLIVPTNLCGTVARRALAAGLGDGTAPGIAGITVLTVDRLAELLAAPRLTGEHRRPTTGPVLAAAWRSALAGQPGLFAQVADHPATVTALVEAHRTLRDLTPDALDAVAATGSLPADVVRLHRDVVGRLSERWYDVTDLRAAASEVLDETDQAGELGAVVVFLPQDLQANSSHLLSALAVRTEVHVIVGLSGDDHADAGVVRGIRRLTPADVPSIPAAPPPATSRRVMHASDADDEVRAVVREVVSALGTTPAHRIAVLFGSASPYARLLHEHLDAAGITVNGPGVRPTAERVLPRALLGLLALADGAGPNRASVFRLLAAAPVRDQAGRLVPASRWERVSRSAGVTGPTSWTPRLTRFAAEKRRAAEEELTQDDPYQGRVDRLRRDAEAADALLAFVDDLRDSSLVGRMATTWSDLSRWSLDTFHAYLGDETTRHRLPEEEQRAAERVERILASLAGLDTVEQHASLTALREVVELELADDLPRVGRFGTGVLVAPLSAAVGLDVDAVWVVGLAEGLCPGRGREDALLPDRARAAAGDALPAARERLDRQHRHLLAAFASGSDVMASFPRGDLRRSGGRLPSRWLLESLRALSGDATLSATDWDRVTGDWLVGSPSYASSVTSTPTPASDQEWRLRALLAGSASRTAVARPDDPAYDRAVGLQRARRSGAFTRFDGNLIALADTLTDPVNDSRPTSPTTLERWVICPHAYFVRRHAAGGAG